MNSITEATAQLPAKESSTDSKINGSMPARGILPRPPPLLKKRLTTRINPNHANYRFRMVDRFSAVASTVTGLDLFTAVVPCSR